MVDSGSAVSSYPEVERVGAHAKLDSFWASIQFLENFAKALGAHNDSADDVGRAEIIVQHRVKITRPNATVCDYTRFFQPNEHTYKTEFIQLKWQWMVMNVYPIRFK